MFFRHVQFKIYEITQDFEGVFCDFLDIYKYLSLCPF